MSDYTPTTAFASREYVTGRLRRTNVTALEARAEFRRMIAEVESAAAVKALTDAADDYLRDSYEIPRVSDWLRARAEAYRREGKEGTNVDMDV